MMILYSAGRILYIKFCLAFIIAAALSQSVSTAQQIDSISLSNSHGINAAAVVLADGTVIPFPSSRPFFSFTYNNVTVTSANSEAYRRDTVYRQVFENTVDVKTILGAKSGKGYRAALVFENISTDTITISNVIPFTMDNSTACITGYGPWDLARAYLYRPGFRQVRVILPDNAWELGYSSFTTGKISVCGLARRQQTEGGQKKRYETVLPPRATVTYNLYTDVFAGEWQNGLRLMFRDRYLYDLGEFSNSLFERSDLQWIKSSYIIVLQMAWDREFFDRTTGKYTYADELRKWNEQFGHIDVFGIWPTWPRLGLDERNQWDMYRQIPGGTLQLKTFARLSRQYNTRFFISYNPWDNSTRKEDHLRGMAALIRETEADGVVLDTRGSSSFELQAAADSVRKGVVMFSEGMAVTRDMPGIIAGRVHNAIYFSPELNLNKLIKPDFSIFRVCDVGEDNNHREIAVSFFNGYGTELNLFRPGGRNDGYRNDLNLLARTTFILRQNNDAFLDLNWTPLITTNADNIYVNEWNSGEKTLFTILNMNPSGMRGRLFRTERREGTHYVSLWNHTEVIPVEEKGSHLISVDIPGWNPSYAGTRLEGSVDCIARFPELLKSKLVNDSLTVNSPGNGKVVIWRGNPEVNTTRYEITFKGDTTFRLTDLTGFYEGKIVIQYLEDGILRDENIAVMKGGNPWLISRTVRTAPETSLPRDMVLVPKASITLTLTTREDFIPYPSVNSPVVFSADSFLIDRFPVTNQQYHEFLLSSGYRPSDTSNFLRHWLNGIYRPGQEKYPVVNVSYEDMKAYAGWAGKRLPTQAEWQIAAQGTDGRKWPWGDEFYGTRCNNSFGRPTPVDAFPKGASPYGAMDIVGNVWQATGDMYFNGTNYFIMIRGGSYYRPDSSWWYIQGGPQQLDRTQIMLLVSQGYDRSSTVGFRCVKDISPEAFREKK